MARLNANGTLDTSFNGSGKFTLAFGQAGITFNSNAFGVTTLADGSLLFGGKAFEQNSGSNSDAMLAHLTSAGTLDTTYGTGGVASCRECVNSHLLVQTDGKVIYLNPSNIYRTTAPVPAVQSTAIVITGTGSKAKASGVTITFNTAVNPTLARNVKIYVLRGGKPKKTLKLKGPVLDATGRMLTFNFAKTSVGKGFLLVITPAQSWVPMARSQTASAHHHHHPAHGDGRGRKEALSSRSRESRLLQELASSLAPAAQPCRSGANGRSGNSKSWTRSNRCEALSFSPRSS